MKAPQPIHQDRNCLFAKQRILYFSSLLFSVALPCPFLHLFLMHASASLSSHLLLLLSISMGNCVLKASGEREQDVVKVLTADGGIMELYTPITADSITAEFPGHAIFKTRSIFSQPLLHTEDLQAGEIYYLLPLNPYRPSTHRTPKLDAHATNVPSTPYRMSTCDNHNAAAAAKKRADPEVFPKYSSTGVWKVKLVISPEQLSEILSQENRTEELIENVRTVAKCGNGVGSAANSDQSSVASSRKGLAVDKQ